MKKEVIIILIVGIITILVLSMTGFLIIQKSNSYLNISLEYSENNISINSISPVILDKKFASMEILNSGDSHLEFFNNKKNN